MNVSAIEGIAKVMTDHPRAGGMPVTPRMIVHELHQAVFGRMRPVSPVMGHGFCMPVSFGRAAQFAEPLEIPPADRSST